MEDLTIDRDFADIHRTLTADEYALLEQDILDNGCLDPIIIWANHQGIILDGHNRYSICTKHKLQFKVKALNIADKPKAMRWVMTHQAGRRNLDTSQRAMLAARIANLDDGQTKAGAQICAPVSQADAAHELNVSRRAVQQASKVLEAGTKSLKDAVQAGEVAVSAAAAIAELPKAEQAKVVARGPEAVKAKVKEVKEAKKADAPKKYNVTFDTAEIEKQKVKPGSEKKTQFKDSVIDDLLGKLVRAVDDRWNKTGGHGNHYRVCVAKLREFGSAWSDWRKAK